MTCTLSIIFKDRSRLGYAASEFAHEQQAKLPMGNLIRRTINLLENTQDRKAQVTSVPFPVPLNPCCCTNPNAPLLLAIYLMQRPLMVGTKLSLALLLLARTAFVFILKGALPITLLCLGFHLIPILAFLVLTGIFIARLCGSVRVKVRVFLTGF